MSSSFFFGAASPIEKLTWVFLRHRRLLLLLEARTAKSVICGTSHLVTTCARRWSDGGGLRVLLRARHTQEDRGRVRCCAWTRQATAQGDPHVQHRDRGSPRTRRLADGTAGDTRCARKHGRVLETSMERAGELVHHAAGQRPAHQAGARPKNRRQGLRVGVPRRLKEVSM